MGFGKTLSRAFLEASGDYVCLLDADDWWMPQKLNVIVSNISSDTLFLRHPMVEVDERGKPLGGTGSCGNTSSLFVHRESAITLLPGTSEILCKPLFDVGRGIEIPAPLAYYRIHPKSMTDRDPKSSHTKFFANTNHVTANRLFTLAQSPPSWARNAAQLRKLGRCYRSEGFTKDFEASLEPYPQRDAFSKMLKMLWSWTYSRGLPEKRHIRLLGRYCKKILLTLHSNYSA